MGVYVLIRLSFFNFTLSHLAIVLVFKLALLGSLDFKRNQLAFFLPSSPFLLSLWLILPSCLVICFHITSGRWFCSQFMGQLDPSESTVSSAFWPFSRFMNNTTVSRLPTLDFTFLLLVPHFFPSYTHTHRLSVHTLLQINWLPHLESDSLQAGGRLFSFFCFELVLSGSFG